jgi:hypothetical protein
MWFDWHHDILTEPSGAMLYLGQSKFSLRKVSKLYLNTEMMKFAEDNGYELPKNFVMMATNMQLLKNDNVKLQINHFFKPKKVFWELAEQRFLRKYSSLYEGAKPLKFAQAKKECVTNSSSGIVAKEETGQMKKRGVLEHEEKWLKGKILDISRGKPVIEVLQNGPKEEIRPLEKLVHEDLSKRKQRAFMSSGMVHHFVGLMLFYNQNQRRLERLLRPDEWSAAGCSLYNGGWDAMARKLLGQGINKFRCKDVTAMESSVVREIQRVIYGARAVCYRAGMTWEKDPDFDEPLDYHRLFDWWVQNTIFSVVLDFEGKVWLKCGQNASGQYLTLFDNIDAMELVFSYHLAKVCPFPQMSDYTQFVASKVLLLMGDDSIFPDDNVWDGLDNSAGECGFAMTDEVDEPVPLERAKFCGFSWLKGKYNTWLFRPTVEKILANVFFNFKKQSFRLCYAKLCAARILFYPLQNGDFQLVNLMLGRLQTHHYQEMMSESHMDELITYHAALCQYKTDSEIEQLLYGLESDHDTRPIETLPLELCRQGKVTPSGVVQLNSIQDGGEEENCEKDHQSSQEEDDQVCEQAWSASAWWRGIQQRSGRSSAKVDPARKDQRALHERHTLARVGQPRS